MSKKGLKTIDSTNLRNHLKDALLAVSEGQTLIVKTRGKDSAVLIDIEQFEDYLAAQDPEFVKSVEEARASTERYTPEEVFGDLWNEVE
jgi:prevent-host-death family protein